MKTLERGSRAAFLKGEEKGAKDAVDGHAARWNSIDEQLATKDRQLWIRQSKLDEEQKRLEGLQETKPAPRQPKARL